MARRAGACLGCWLAVQLACGSAALAQAPVRKIRQKMTDTLNGTPNFMCSVSIERTERAGKGPVAGLPVLRVNVGVIDGKELYSLPSTDDDQALLKKVLALYGRAGTGSFAMYARAIFFTAAATFYDGPEETKDGRTLSRLDFAMPREVSHYALLVAGQPMELGYSGSIWTDPRNLEVARLFLQADAIPPDVGIKAVTQTIEYGHTSIRGFSQLVPVASDLTLQELSGRELRITEHFSDCQAHLPKSGEQLVENELKVPAMVSRPASTEAPATASPASASLPAAAGGLPSIEELLPAKTAFEMILKDPIDERNTTTNSKLAFVVSQDVKLNGKVIVPRGATAMGHVTRILRQTYIEYAAERGYYAVGLQLDTMDVGDRRYRIWANLERVGPPATQICFIPYSHSPDKFGPFEVIYTLFLIPKPEYGESFLGVVYEFLRLGSDWRTYWTVTKAPA
jgi:hypothetical protein